MKNPDERAWDAIKSIRAHFAAHLDVAREDGNADQERGARALLEDLDVLRIRVEYEGDRIEAAIEAGCSQRGIVEQIAVALDGRGASAAARLVRDTDPDDDLWNNYIGPMIDSIQDDYGAIAAEMEDEA